MNDSLTNVSVAVAAIIFMAVLGVYSYNDRGRTLECRTQAQTKGVVVNDAVQLCKH